MKKPLKRSAFGIQQLWNRCSADRSYHFAWIGSVSSCATRSDCLDGQSYLCFLAFAAFAFSPFSPGSCMVGIGAISGPIRRTEVSRIA
jgi:hypothetical protein